MNNRIFAGYRRSSAHTPSLALRLALVLTVAALGGGCASDGEPRFRTVVADTFAIEAVGGASKQTKQRITVEDMGEAQQVVRPMQVQACDGPHLRYDEKKTKSGRIRQVPVYETVDPLQGIYVRRLKISNDTNNVMRLDRIDVVLVDAAGNDNEGMSKDVLQQNIKAARPCSSTQALVNSLRSLKILGSDARIRPGRRVEMLAAFASVDKSIVGDWTLEMNDFPVATNQAGEVTQVTSFKYPFVSKGYRTSIKYRKDSFFSPWVEVDRETEEIDPGS